MIVYTHWVCIGGYTLIKDWKTVLLIIGINVGLKLFTITCLETPCVTTKFWKHVWRREGGRVKELMMLGQPSNGRASTPPRVWVGGGVTPRLLQADVNRGIKDSYTVIISS